MVTIPDETRQSILSVLNERSQELINFAADLVRIPTVNPPGEAYVQCAERIEAELKALGFTTEIIEATGRPEHTQAYPRPNVLGTLGPVDARPCVHLNGHFDVVPPGEGWTGDPFSGAVEDGRLYGRGSADMKAGLAAAVYAAFAVRAAGMDTGRIEVSGTVDEESGGFAGVAHLAEIGRISSERTDHAIIPEPFGVDRICVGHRGVYWFEVTAWGRTGHGSMPFLGRSAIDDLAAFLEAIRTTLKPVIQRRRTTMPVVPEGAQFGSINVNAVQGGQDLTEANEGLQTPCVADKATAVFDRRFLPEESVDDVRAEVIAIADALTQEDPERRYEFRDLMIVQPTKTPDPSPVADALTAAIQDVVGGPAQRVASPGTYDHKHFARLGGVVDCVAYGPGTLEAAHQPDESCSVDAIITSAKVMALAISELLSRSD